METTVTLTTEEMTTLLAGLEYLLRETRAKKHMLGSVGFAEATGKLTAMAAKLAVRK